METSEWNVCVFALLLHLRLIVKHADDACVTGAVICVALYSYHRTHESERNHASIFTSCTEVPP